MRWLLYSALTAASARWHIGRYSRWQRWPAAGESPAERWNAINARLRDESEIRQWHLDAGRAAWASLIYVHISRWCIAFGTLHGSWLASSSALHPCGGQVSCVAVVYLSHTLVHTQYWPAAAVYSCWWLMCVCTHVSCCCCCQLWWPSLPLTLPVYRQSNVIIRRRLPTSFRSLHILLRIIVFTARSYAKALC